MAGPRNVCDSRRTMSRTAVPRLALLALLTAVPLAHADEPSIFQAALHGSYRAGGGLEDEASGEDRDFDDGGGIALALELRYQRGDDRFYQLWYSRQSTDFDDATGSHDADIEYLHVGGTLPFGGWERAQPYFAAGLGATRFTASAPESDDRVRFSGSAALGLEIPLAAHAAIRLEARGYITAVDTSSAFFCKSDGGEGVCAVVASGSTFVQGEALAGIRVRF
jgi:opacity protein-like surface antigen